MSINIVAHKSQGLLNDCLLLKEKYENEYNVNQLICEEHEIYTKTENCLYDKQFFIEHLYPKLLKNSKYPS